MELVIVGCCGPAGAAERPLLLIDAAYTNYKAFAERLGRATVSITRTLGDDGRFSLPAMRRDRRDHDREHRPGAMVVIPYDNPTGQLYDRETLVDLAAPVRRARPVADQRRGLPRAATTRGTRRSACGG